MSQEESLLTSWEALVANAPEAHALIEAATGEIHTRRLLDARATALAALLGSERTPGTLSEAILRFTPTRPLTGALIAFSRPNGADWLAAFLALLQLGTVPLPLDPSENPESQLTLAKAARAHFLLT